jgi:hypothetical protein
VASGENFCPKSDFFLKSDFFDFFQIFGIFLKISKFSRILNWAPETSFGRMESFLGLFYASGANSTDCKKKNIFFRFSVFSAGILTVPFSTNGKM